MLFRWPYPEWMNTMFYSKNLFIMAFQEYKSSRSIIILNAWPLLFVIKAPQDLND